MAQEIGETDDLKQYLVENVAGATKWDRAISVTSNQGFETLMCLPEEFKPDPLPVKDSPSKAQDTYLKQDIKKTSNVMGVRINVKATSNLLSSVPLAIGRAERGLFRTCS